MILAAQVRLDAKTDECEEFRVSSESTQEQIQNDLDRLAYQLGNTERAITAQKGGMAAMDDANRATDLELQEEKLAYFAIRDADQLQLDERQANLDVGTFILKFTECPAGGSLLQRGAGTSR